MKFKFFSFLILATFAFNACEKGTLKEEEDKEIFKDEDEWDGKDELNWDEKDCFELVYPVTYTMPDGTTISGNADEIEAAMKEWYDAHPDSEAKPELQFPVEIIIGDALMAVANEEKMEAIKKDCFGDVDDLIICDWDGSKVSDTDIWEEHIVEPLEVNDECGCTVGGIIKYTKIDVDDFTYVIYYGFGECDEWAYLVTYYGGDDKKEEKCKFKLDCNP